MDDLRNNIITPWFSFFIYVVYPNMYHDLQEVFCWDCLKKDIEEFIAKIPNFEQFNAENQKSGGIHQEIKVPLGNGNIIIWT